MTAGNSVAMAHGGWKGTRLFSSWETWVVLSLCLLLTGIAWSLLDDQVSRLNEARFRSRANDLTGNIITRLNSYELMLRGAVALFNAEGGHVSRTEWRTYCSDLQVQDSYPGIQGVGYAQRVLPENRAAFVASVRAEGFPDYDITPAGPRPEYFPIVYLEPFASRNLRAFGYDMHTEPDRREAMERARDNGTAAATHEVRLVQETETDVQSGFLIYLPVYDQHRSLATLSARHDALLGFVYSPFRMRNFMRTVVTPGVAEYLDVQVYDGVEPTADRLMYATPGPHHSRVQVIRRIDVFGQVWALRIGSAPGFEATTGSALPRAVLVAGGIITLLMLAIMDSVLRERDRTAALRLSNEALTRARTEAEEANAAKSRFLAAASHDLRQPLQTLGIYLHMIGEQAETATMRRLVAAARDGFEATQRLLNSLMDIAMLETGVMRPTLVEIDLPAFLNRICAHIRVEAAGKGLEFRLAGCTRRLVSDPVMLERILLNLLHNALKYTDRGVIRLACRCRPGGTVALTVQDTGPGIPRDRMHLIFEDFYQIGNPERDRGKGLGLGLATVARLTRLLGYRVRVLSRPGRGAVFLVEIPPAPATSAAPDDAKPPQPAPASSACSASNTDAM